MGAPEGLPPPTERVRLRRRIEHRPSLRARIKRRARVLAFLERERCIDAMIAELYLGRITEQDIEAWEPVRGSAPFLEDLYARIRARQERKDT